MRFPRMCLHMRNPRTPEKKPSPRQGLDSAHGGYAAQLASSCSLCNSDPRENLSECTNAAPNAIGCSRDNVQQGLFPQLGSYSSAAYGFAVSAAWPPASPSERPCQPCLRQARPPPASKPQGPSPSYGSAT